jgi:hypothetical protein
MTRQIFFLCACLVTLQINCVTIRRRKKRLSHSQGKMQQRKEQGVESERGASRQKITYH